MLVTPIAHLQPAALKDTTASVPAHDRKRYITEAQLLKPGNHAQHLIWGQTWLRRHCEPLQLPASIGQLNNREFRSAQVDISQHQLPGKHTGQNIDFEGDTIDEQRLSRIGA